MSINFNSKEGNFFLSEQNDNHRWKMSNTPYQTINRKKEVYSLILNFPLFIFPFPILHFPIPHSLRTDFLCEKKASVFDERFLSEHFLDLE